MCKDGGFYSQRQHASWPSPPTPNTVLEKIVMMDIDTMVLASVHDRFDLSAPAAMKRGMCNDVRGLKHGDPIEGTSLLGGRGNGKYPRGPSTGINAGFMCYGSRKRMLSMPYGTPYNRQNQENQRIFVGKSTFPRCALFWL